VNFYANNAGQPGSVLATTIVPGTANETSQGVDGGGYPEFSYSATLTTPFAAAAGTEYWMSVVPDLTFPPQWGWVTGSGGDGGSYQFYQGGNPLETDEAFTLYGASRVPETGHTAILLMAVLGGFMVRQRMTRAGAKANA